MIKYTPRLPEPEDNVNVSRVHPLQELAKLAGGGLILLVLLYVLLGFAVDLAVMWVPPSMERNLTFLCDAYLKKEPAVPEKTERVQGLLNRLTARLEGYDLELRGHVVRSYSVNAVACPGGDVIVMSGLLDEVETDEELAFVLGHEIGHFVHRDHLRSMGRSLVFMVMATLLFGEDSDISQMVRGSYSLTSVHYNQQQELEADQFAMELLDGSGIGLDGGLAFFSRKSVADGGFLQTHPPNRERAERIRRFIRSHSAGRT